MVQSQGGYCQCKDVTLHESGGQERPRVYEGELWDQVQIRDDDVRVCGPLLVTDGSAQDTLQAQSDEQDARDGRDIYSGRHNGC